MFILCLIFCSLHSKTIFFFVGLEKDQSMKYLARFDWKKHPARKDSLVEIHLDCYLEDSDICKAIVDTLMDISNHPKIESVIYQLHTSRKIRLFGIKVNPLCFVLEQPNFVQKKGLWGITLEHDTVESVDHIIRIISSLLPEEIVMTRDSWTVRQHHMDDLSKWKFNSPWKFIIRLQEEEGISLWLFLMKSMQAI